MIQVSPSPVMIASASASDATIVKELQLSKLSDQVFAEFRGTGLGRECFHVDPFDSRYLVHWLARNCGWVDDTKTNSRCQKHPHWESLENLNHSIVTSKSST